MKDEILFRPGTNTLGVIFFCLAFGTVLGSLGSSGKQLVTIFGTIDQVEDCPETTSSLASQFLQVIMRMVLAIMWVSPVGIASVIAAKILAVDDIAV